ncbi:MAG: glycogen/starch synthase [Thermoanaerobaculia bacterium]
MTRKLRIAFVSAEVSPFAKTGGLGDVAGALPRQLGVHGHDVVVFTPWYRQTREYFEAAGVQPETLASLMIIWPGFSAPVTLLRSTLPGSGVPVIFVANDALFDRDGIYALRDGIYDDLLERFTFFCRAVIAACETLGFSPDILHANDWHTALLPIMLANGLRHSPHFAHCASVFTIHNLNYQGRYGAEHFPGTGLPFSLWSPAAVEYFGDLNLMKGAIIFADRVTAVSPNYAKEIQTPPFGAGLDGILREHASKLVGILNGIDVEEWNPETDRYIPARFSTESLAGKADCRRELRKEAGLQPRPRTPVIGIISRLVEQKGFDLLLPEIPRLLSLGAQFVVLGSGASFIEEAFRSFERDFSAQFRTWITFDLGLSHRIIAGSDLLLMPSHYEPCGLNQMYALRYGTLPIVRLTGGLADTVLPFDGSNRRIANGFGFGRPDAEMLFLISWIAMLSWKDEALRRTLQRNGMSADFSWDHSAREYERVYRSTIGA